jgi:malic enzyme
MKFPGQSPSQPSQSDAGDAKQVVPVPLRGQPLLNQPLLNKGTAFSPEERAALGLEGLLPAKVSTIEQQVQRAYEAISRKSDPLERYIGLLAIQDRNEHLFYRLLLDHIEEFLPIVYTPTVGLACQQFSRIYRRPRGVWITPEHRGRIRQVLANAPAEGIRLIVVTDNERILGLGDLGAGGIGIPIGKLTLYTVAAGIHPSHTLPISLDVGTDNQQLLEDALYVGWRHPRLRNEPYFDLIEEFVTAVQHRFPAALLQWEDFKKQLAFTLLDRYANRLPSFNDDIQGTAAVAVAAVLSAARLTRTPVNQQRVVIVGAGAAGIGIARQLRSLFQRYGLQGADLTRSIAVLDSEGFLHEGRSLREQTKREVAWPIDLAQACGLAGKSAAQLVDVVRVLRPTVLIGVSGQTDAFTEPVVCLMAQGVDQPVILPLSNPTSKSEARPADLLAWTNGRAVIAAGSPSEPVTWRGRTIRIGQANNIYIFPGIGLGVLTSRAPRVTDAMFTVAAEVLASEVSDADLSAGLLFPPLSALRQVTARVAEAVMRHAVENGLAQPLSDVSVSEAIAAAMWVPAYLQFVPTTV